jgi:hypothetical protein
MLLRSLRSTYGLVSIQSRSFKYKQNTRSFLSDKERVRDFVALLGPQERHLLYEELHELEQNSSLNAVKSESKAEEEHISITCPTFSQLRQVFIHQSLPFVGFGFLDNLIMIIAGDYIDATIGVTLGISTMAAAGLGNALSDVAGIGSAYYVEQFAAKIGVKTPKLSLVQLQMPRTRWSIQLGRAFGVAIGCIIGMFPLLFLPTKHSDNKTATQESVPKHFSTLV